MEEKMTDLITRLSTATGPSRELDGEIALTFGLVPPGMERADDAWWGGGGKQWDAPCYTESIDAALTLVPEGYCWAIKQGFQCEATVWSVCIDYQDRDPPLGYSTRFPAIALVIACLKAKEESKP